MLNAQSQYYVAIFPAAYYHESLKTHLLSYIYINVHVYKITLFKILLYQTAFEEEIIFRKHQYHIQQHAYCNKNVQNSR